MYLGAELTPLGCATKLLGREDVLELGQVLREVQRNQAVLRDLFGVHPRRCEDLRLVVEEFRVPDAVDPHERTEARKVNIVNEDPTAGSANP